MLRMCVSASAFYCWKLHVVSIISHHFANQGGINVVRAPSSHKLNRINRTHVFTRVRRQCVDCCCWAVSVMMTMVMVGIPITRTPVHRAMGWGSWEYFTAHVYYSMSICEKYASVSSACTSRQLCAPMGEYCKYVYVYVHVYIGASRACMFWWANIRSIEILFVYVGAVGGVWMNCQWF